MESPTEKTMERFFWDIWINAVGHNDWRGQWRMRLCAWRIKEEKMLTNIYGIFWLLLNVISIKCSWTWFIDSIACMQVQCPQNE